MRRRAVHSHTRTITRLGGGGALAAALALGAPLAAQQGKPAGTPSGPIGNGIAAAEAASEHVLRVCGDPDNLPFSNEKQEGFENKIAELIARDLGDSVHYLWWPHRRGFVRSTLRAGECDMLIGVPMGESAEKEKAVSPVTFVAKDNPPFLIIHGTADTLVPYAQSTEFADALKRAGVNVVLQPVPGAGHGGPQFASPAANRLYKKFFDKHLKGTDVNVEPLPAEELAAPQPAPAK